MAMMSKQPRKPLKWVGYAKRDLDAMPKDIKDLFGHAIDLAQAGGKHQDTKVLTGFGSAGVLEVVEDDRGIKTPKEDMDLVHARLKAAKQDFEAWQAQQGARR